MDKYLVQQLLKESNKKSEEQKKKMRYDHKRDYSQFTIEGVPMKVIFVRNVLPKWTEERLSRLFSHYGPVSKVHVMVQHRPRKKKCALVFFKNSKDAEKVLKQQFIHVSKYRMFVFPGYGIYHKKGKPEESEASSGEGSSSQADGEPLTEIDLPSGTPYEFPKDLLKLPLLKGMLQHSGAHLKKLNLQKAEIFGADALIEAIVSSCSQLEDLRLANLYINDSKILKLKAFDKLKVLSLHQCNPIKDFHLEWLLEKNSVLTQLEVTGTCYVRGKFLEKVKSPLQSLDLSYNGFLEPFSLREPLEQLSSTLEHFALSNCKHVEYSAMDDLIEILPNLKSLTFARYKAQMDGLDMNNIMLLKQLESLDLSHNENVSDLLLKDIVENCVQLKCLDLSSSSVCEFQFAEEGGFDIAEINTLQNLRSLNLSYLRDLKAQSLRKYVAASPPIESLFLVNIYQLTDEDMECVLSSCHQLKHLDFSGCSKITEATLTAAVNVLNERVNNQPLCLVVGGTKIKKPTKRGNSQNAQANLAKSHPLLTIDYEESGKKESGFSNDDADDEDIDDWTHLMYGTGKEVYYLLSDEDDSDFDYLNTSDFEDDDSDDDEDKYDLDPRSNRFGHRDDNCVLT